MAYFLKKQRQNNNTYLAIYESFYSKASHGTKHKCHKSLGSITKLIESGIEDPISYFQNEVDKLNNESSRKVISKISSSSPLRYLGFFPFQAILNTLAVKNEIDLFKYTTNYTFDLYEVLSSLIYARAVKPCSKHKTYHEVIPFLFNDYDFSYDQCLEGLSFFGNDYEKFVELFTHKVKKHYGIQTDAVYFDCTNFYFEIDKEDELRRKGPSKENRHDPLLGLGLLLDSNQIPIGMKLYPGNQSEKPIIREVINELKDRCEVKGKTIQVADKGLNCSENILSALANGDGYLFSKSIKQLPETEITWVLLTSDYQTVKEANGSVLYQYKDCIEEFPYNYIDANKKNKKVLIKEKRVITYTPSLATKQTLEIQKMIEKAKGLCLSKAKLEEYGDSAKYVNFKGSDGSKAAVTINEAKVEKDLKLAGYNLLVTSELKMTSQEIISTYHNLWRIEESFRIMKTDLDARPVFLQKESTIKGHFLICYLTVLLFRLFQFKVLDNQYSSSKITEFIKEFKVVKNNNAYTNITIGNEFITSLSKITSLPLDHLILSENQIKKVLNCKI